MEQGNNMEASQQQMQPVAPLTTAQEVQPVTPSQPTTPREDQPLVAWKASEFIHHQKSASWFFPLVIGAALLAVLTYFFGGGIIGSIVVITGAIAFGIFAGQEPRTLEYALYPSKLIVDGKDYSYDDFKSFSISQNGGLFSVNLEPIKRFFPAVSIYFPQEDGEKIFDIFATHLPAIDAPSDPIENLMRKIRF